MNMEIKFRLWDGEKMINDGVAFLSDRTFAVQRESSGWDWDFEFERKGMPDFVVMQYIGLKDKSGVDIYGGDILKSGDWSYVVEYDSTHAYWRARVVIHQDVDTHDCIPIGDLSSNTEVIGNIHQNPELLK